MARGRKPDPQKAPNLRPQSAAYAVGRLHDFPCIEEVARRHTCDTPGAGEEENPVVYICCGEVGRRPPADLFYMLRNGKYGIRVYFREAVDIG